MEVEQRQSSHWGFQKITFRYIGIHFAGVYHLVLYFSCGKYLPHYNDIFLCSTNEHDTYLHITHIKLYIATLFLRNFHMIRHKILSAIK